MLVFDPSLLNFVVEYKLVYDFASNLERYEFEIHSSVNGSWKVLAEISFSKIELFPRTRIQHYLFEFVLAWVEFYFFNLFIS